VQLGKTHPDDHQPHGWARWARGVAGAPWPAMLGAVTVLAVLAIPVLKLHLGQTDIGALPTDTQSRQAYDIISRGFGAGTNGPLLVAVRFGSPAKPDQKALNEVESKQKQLDASKQQLSASQAQLKSLPPSAQTQAQLQELESQAKQLEGQQQQLDSQRKQAQSPASDPQLATLRNEIAHTPGVKSVGPPTLDKAGDAAVFTAIATTAPSSQSTEDLVIKLRDSVIPAAVKGTDLHADVGGQTASYIDLAKRISSKLPWMI